MTQRYWECGELPEALQSAIADFVEQNVKQALSGDWDETVPSCYFAVLNGKATIEVYSPETVDGAGDPQTYKHEYDLLDEIRSWLPRKYEISQMSEARVQPYITFLKQLAGDIEAIAADIESVRNVAGQ